MHIETSSVLPDMQNPAMDHSLKERATQVLSAVKAANMTIVIAESCTAGAIVSLLAPPRSGACA